MLRAELRAVGRGKETRKAARAESTAGEQGHGAHGGPEARGLRPGAWALRQPQLHALVSPGLSFQVSLNSFPFPALAPAKVLLEGKKNT